MQSRLIMVGACLLLLLGCAGGLYAYAQARSALAEANGTIKVLEASVEAYREAQVHVQEVIQNASAARQEIDHALSANKDWAGTSVPDAVVAGLCKNSLCKAGEVPASGD